jgi:hypothetical protein
MESHLLSPRLPDTPNAIVRIQSVSLACVVIGTPE